MSSFKSESTFQKRDGLPRAAGMVAVLFWGATPAATVLVAGDIPSNLIGPSRLLLTALILLPIIVILRPALPKDRAGWAELAVNAAIGFAATLFLQGVGFAHTTTSHGALILASAPVITATIQNLICRRWPTYMWWLGSAIALTGEAYIIMSGSGSSGAAGATVLGDIIVLLGTITVSLGYISGARLSSRIGLFSATSWSIVFGSLIMLPVLPSIIRHFPEFSQTSASSLIFLSAGCTLIGYGAWFWAMSKDGISTIAPLQFAQPVVSFIIAFFFLAESVTISTLVAVGMVLAGVYICRASAIRNEKLVQTIANIDADAPKAIVP